MSSGTGNLYAETEPLDHEIEAGAPLGGRSGGLWKDAWRRLKKMPVPFFCFGVTVALLGLAAASWLGVPLSPYGYDQTSDSLLAAPSLQHPMGTDELGRDLLSRIIYGARLSIAIGFFTAGTAFAIGTVYGSIAGFCGGKVDSLLMRGVDIAYSLPDLLVMILVGVMLPAALGRSTLGILLALGLVSWMGTARLVRAQLLQLKHEEFIDAAQVAGQSPTKILLNHLLPNALGPIIVALTFTVPSAILAESTLSFIGLGLSPPACSWGTLASEGWRALRTHPHLIMFPSFFIFCTVLSFNILGDGLRDALDPRTRVSVSVVK
jgi:oligopeptide transport system permease protein